MKRAVLLFVLPILLSVACTVLPELPQAAALPTPRPIASGKTTCLLTTHRALEAMYGEEALFIGDVEAILPSPVAGYTTTVNINLMACFWEDSAEKCLVITDRAFDKAHVSQATIDGAIFLREKSSWELGAFHRDIISLGSFGYIPKGELIQIGPHQHAALLRSNYAGQGYENDYVTIIAEVDGEMLAVLHLLVSEMQEAVPNDDAGSLQWGYTSKLTFQSGNHSEFDDIVVTRYGVTQAGLPFKTVDAYAFSETSHSYTLVRK